MKYFFIGIKGVGMTSLATIYKEWGEEVSGSDTEEEFFTDRILADLGIRVVSFGIPLPLGVTQVIYSSAYTLDHTQLKDARAKGIEILSYGEALRDMFNSRKGILVTGTHGKTTSTAMMGRVLEDAGFDPTVVVGGEVLEWERTARAGKTQLGGRTAKLGWMVAEGDEYQAKILMLKSHLLLLTNIEYDHPDFYPDETAYRKTFEILLESLGTASHVVAHESLREFLQNSGTHARVVFFDGDFDESLKKEMSLELWGAHNRTNALGVLRAAEVLGVDRSQILKTLSRFRGTRRRMELYTDKKADIVIMDDYAHHPTEIRATLAALRAQYPDREIIAVFQPHTYSRTKALLNDFAKSFGDASTVVLIDVYASAREQKGEIGGRDLFEATKFNHPRVFFAENLAAGYEILEPLVKKKSAVVTLGAGDVWHIADRLRSRESGSR